MKGTQLKLSALAGAVGLAASVLVGSAVAQDYPNRPIEVVVPFAAGGSIDITFRAIAPGLSEELGQQVLIVNKPGAAATLGMNEVAKAQPDGYTLGAASFAFAVQKLVMDNVPYNPLTDFEFVTQIGQSPMLLVTYPDAPAKSVDEFIAWAKSKPGELNFGSVGAGSSGHLMTELFAQRAGLEMIHVPFTKGPLGALARGDIHMQIAPIPSVLPWVKDGRLKALGVTSLKPYSTVSDLPPIANTMEGFNTFEWPSLVAPKGTPKAIVDKIRNAVNKVVDAPEMQEKFAALGTDPVGGTPEELAAFVKEQVELWEKTAQTLSKVGDENKLK
jgi:tripartite-type tricarboxylate transporter receptor subunit TctC